MYFVCLNIQGRYICLWKRQHLYPGQPKGYRFFCSWARLFIPTYHFCREIFRFFFPAPAEKKNRNQKTRKKKGESRKKNGTHKEKSNGKKARCKIRGKKKKQNPKVIFILPTKKKITSTTSQKWFVVFMRGFVVTTLLVNYHF